MDVITNYNGANAATLQSRPTQAPGGPGAERPVMQRPTAQRLTASQISQIVAASTSTVGTRMQEQEPQAVASRTYLRDESITDTMLDQAFEDANRILSGGTFKLSYDRHEATGRIMVTVYNAQSDEVIRELPPESRLDIYARITEFVGLMFDQGN